jgi:hypothetical protein
MLYFRRQFYLQLKRGGSMKPEENFLPKDRQFIYAVEVGPEEGAIAWVLNLPGCHVLTPLAMAQERAEEATREFLSWLKGHGEEVPEPPFVFKCVEVVRSREDKRQGRTSAFFQADSEPVWPEEIYWCLKLMAYSRQDLLELLESLPQGALEWGKAGKSQWTIKTYLQHIASAERWYLTKFWPRLPDLGRAPTPLIRLERVRALSLEKLMGASEEERRKVVKVKDGERWSLRKILRRMIYHERYHFWKIKDIAGAHLA